MADDSRGNLLDSYAFENTDLQRAILHMLRAIYWQNLEIEELRLWEKQRGY